MAVVLLVRHAQASFGAADYDALSSLGERQSAVLGRRLTALPRIDRVVHGAMRRQRDTARLALAARDGVPPHGTDARWDEYDHEAILAASLPDAAARTAFHEQVAAADDPRRVFQEQFTRALRRWTGGAAPVPDLEAFSAFRTRVTAALTALTGDLARSETAVVVTSGGVIAAVCAAQLGLDGDRWAALNHVLVNTSITKLVVGRSGTTLLSLNDHAHLEGEPRELLTYR
jgi:broad specificity phosphatase PhoE